jgi:hypothetical protein
MSASAFAITPVSGGGEGQGGRPDEEKLLCVRKGEGMICKHVTLDGVTIERTTAGLLIRGDRLAVKGIEGG